MNIASAALDDENTHAGRRRRLPAAQPFLLLPGAQADMILLAAAPWVHAV